MPCRIRGLWYEVEQAGRENGKCVVVKIRGHVRQRPPSWSKGQASTRPMRA